MPAIPRHDSRSLAWDILKHWKPEGLFAEEMIDRACRTHSLTGPNRGLLNAIVLGVLRHRQVLDLWIDHLRSGGKFAQRHSRVTADRAAANHGFRNAGARFGK